MPDPRFYRRAGPFRLDELAARSGAALAPGTQGNLVIEDVGTIEHAGAAQIAYFADPRYVIAFLSSKCGACVTTDAFVARAPKGCAVLIAENPRVAFAAIAGQFYPPPTPDEARRTQMIAADAQVGAGTFIAPGASVGPRAAIGKDCIIESGAAIGPGVVIGDGCRIGANVTITHCLMGARVIVHPGVQIGQDGFGFAPTPDGLRKIPQLGRVLIGDDVEIGANSTVDRGAAADTVIGAGTKIDNLVQIAHNVRIGRNCIIVSQAGIAGSARIGEGVIIGGQAAVVEHLEVGDGAQIAGKSGVMRDVAPGEVVMGYPAKPIRRFWRETAALSRLTKRDNRP